MRKRPDRDEIHARLRVRAHVFQIDSARTLQRNAACVPRTDLNSLAHILNAYMVKQDRLRPVFQRQLQFFERLHFNLDRLPATPVVDGTLQRRNRTPGQRYVIAFDQHAVGEIEPVILPAAAKPCGLCWKS